MLRYKKGQYVKTTLSLSPAPEALYVSSYMTLPGDVLKILVVGPFYEGDIIIVDRTSAKFRVATGVTFDYFCEVCKFPDCYVALSEAQIEDLAKF